jgi:hypothetical protein
VIDVGDPRNPALVGWVATGGNAWDITVSGDLAYLADGADGLWVVDITGAVGGYERIVNTPGYAIGVAVDGDYAFVGDYDRGLQVIDISDTSTAAIVGTCNTPGYAYGVAVAGDYAYVADLSSGLQVIDISNPAAPTIAGSCAISGDVMGVTVEGDYAYVTEFTSGRLVVIDISDPTHPTFITDFDLSARARGVAICGDYAYVADYTSLQVLEVYQRRYDTNSNAARSLTLDPSGYAIERVRMTSAQKNQILWQVSADGGSHWQDMAPSGAWYTLAYQGNDLRWRAGLFCTDGITNPYCDYVKIEWAYTTASVDGSKDAADVPAAFALTPGQPNPFSLRTSLGFDLPVGSTVNLIVFDTRGRLVKTLVNQAYPAGRHSVVWGGDDDAGRAAGSGIYFVRMMAGDFRATCKVLLAR